MGYRGYMAETGSGNDMASAILASVHRKQDLARDAGQTTNEAVLEAASRKKQLREKTANGKLTETVRKEGPEMPLNRILAAVYRNREPAPASVSTALPEKPLQPPPKTIGPDHVAALIKRIRKI